MGAARQAYADWNMITQHVILPSAKDCAFVNFFFLLFWVVGVEGGGVFYSLVVLLLEICESSSYSSSFLIDFTANFIDVKILLHFGSGCLILQSTLWTWRRCVPSFAASFIDVKILLHI